MTAGAAPQAWRRRAACVGKPSEVFFPPDDAALAALWSPEAAQAVCATCPVREACLEWAVATRQPDGVWGGAEPIQLRRLWRRPRSRQARAS